MANVLITGSSGLIGSHLTLNLLVTGKIVTLARGGKRMQNQDATNQIYHDLSQISVDDISKIYKKYKITHLVHCAGLKKVISDTHHEFNKNVIDKLIQADTKKNIHFIVMGSIGEYGIVENGLMEENMVCKPAGRYAISKLEQTQLCEFHFKKGHKINVIRLANPILPGLLETTFIGAVLKSLKTNSPLIVNDENIERDFVDGRDLTNFINKLINNQFVPQIVVNFGSGTNHSYKHCVVRINQILSKLDKNYVLKCQVVGKSENYSKAIVSTEILRGTFKFKSRYTLDDSLEWILRSAFS